MAVLAGAAPIYRPARHRGGPRRPAALAAFRAHRDQTLYLVHLAMVLLGLALPYLGFADMEGRRLEGNTMVFGLALLSFAWIAIVAARPTPLHTGARSTVLVVYGAVAVAAMVLRVVVERVPVGPLGWRARRARPF